MAKVPLDEITHINEDDISVWSCDNCGAHSMTGPNDITHHDSCVPGEAKKWESYYSEVNEEGDQ